MINDQIIEFDDDIDNDGDAVMVGTRTDGGAIVGIDEDRFCCCFFLRLRPQNHDL